MRRELQPHLAVLSCRALKALFFHFMYEDKGLYELSFEEIKWKLPNIDVLKKQRFCGPKTLEEIALWLDRKPLPEQTKRRAKKLKLFGWDIQVTVTYKKSKKNSILN